MRKEAYKRSTKIDWVVFDDENSLNCCNSNGGISRTCRSGLQWHSKWKYMNRTNRWKFESPKSLLTIFRKLIWSLGRLSGECIPAVARTQCITIMLANVSARKHIFFENDRCSGDKSTRYAGARSGAMKTKIKHKQIKTAFAHLVSRALSNERKWKWQKIKISFAKY